MTEFKVGDKVKGLPESLDTLAVYGIVAGQSYTIRRIIHKQILFHPYGFLELEGVGPHLNALFFEYYKASTAFVLSDEDD